MAHEPAGRPERMLAEHVSRATFADLAAPTVDAARRQLVWTVGSCLLGLGRDRESGVAETLQRLGGPGPVGVMGTAVRLSPASAGMVHGYLTKLPEYEDKFWKGGTHGYAVATAVVPAALAVAAAVGADGARLLSGIAVAVDLQARILAATPGYDTDTGWNVTYLYAALGAAAASAHLMGLGPDATLDALGIAFTQAAGPMQSNVERADVIPVQMGFGVRNGVCAAELAAGGLTGPREFLTGRHGLFNLQMAGQVVDLGALTDDLGATFLSERIGFKGYPCGAVVHPALEAVRAVVGDGVAAPDVARITITGTTRLRVMLQEGDAPAADPVTRAIFSLPWAVACTAVDGDLRLGHFEAPALDDPRYHRLAERVDVVVEEGRDTTAATVEFVDGGRRASPEILVPRGHPDQPLTTAEIVERYWDCWGHGSPVVSREGAEQALALMLGIEESASPGSVVDHLGPRPAGVAR